MNPQVGVIGLALVVHFTSVEVNEDGTLTTTDLDISTATTLTIYLKKPGSAGATLAKTGVLDTTGTDGLAKYVTVANDLDTPGIWTIQGRAVIAGKDWPTEPVEFTVKRNTY